MQSTDLFAEGVTKRMDVMEDKAFALLSLCSFGIAPIRERETVKWLQLEFKGIIEIQKPVSDDYLNQHWIAKATKKMTLETWVVRWANALNFRYTVVVRLPKQNNISQTNAERGR